MKQRHDDPLLAEQQRRRRGLSQYFSALELLILAAIVVGIFFLGYCSGEARGHAYKAPWPWIAIADCESGDGKSPGRKPWSVSWHNDDYHDGGLQFHPDTWDRAKIHHDVKKIASRYRRAFHAPPWVQVAVARSWLRRTDWKQWPECSRIVGLR